MNYSAKTQYGFSLIDALIGLVVLGVGLLAVAGFNTDLMQSSSGSKAQNEALNLAQQVIEDFRDYSTAAEYNAIATGTDQVNGTNAAYTRTRTVVDSATPPYKNVTVDVSWTDSDDVAQTVRLNSIIAWSNPENQGKLLAGELGGMGGPPNNSTPAPPDGDEPEPTDAPPDPPADPDPTVAPPEPTATPSYLPCNCRYKNKDGITVVDLDDGRPSSACCTVEICEAAAPGGNIQNNTYWSTSCSQ